MTSRFESIDAQAILAEMVDEFTGVVGFAELMQDDDDKRKEHAEEVLRCAERALELVWVLSDALPVNLGRNRLSQLGEIVLDLEPSLRRVVGPGHPLTVNIQPSPARVRMARRDLEALILHLVAASRDAYSTPGPIRVTASRGEGSDGAALGRVAIEDHAGIPRIGDLRWFLLDAGSTDLLNPLTPFIERVREAGGAVRIEATLDDPVTRIYVELPIVESRIASPRMTRGRSHSGVDEGR